MTVRESEERGIAASPFLLSLSIKASPKQNIHFLYHLLCLGE
jgi:hypothetical protein